jgi:nucleotide-binding universal stress UspA family protein
MTDRPSLLCPVDFSDPSRAALSYAAAIADHFGARLIVATVDDPLLASAAASTGHVPSLSQETERELRQFVAETIGDHAGAGSVDYRTAVGKAAHEIGRIAAENHAELIVMSSHGRSGISKRFFGSTTERVLRETTRPVLVTPAARPRAVPLSEMSLDLHSVVAPVDLSDASSHQVRVAAGLAAALSVPLLLAHVLEPVFIPIGLRHVVPDADDERRVDAENRLRSLARSAAPNVSTETLVLGGDPAEQIAELTRARGARLIVMGLHSSGLLGPRMGSVTYRVLSLADALVLALPPVAAASPSHMSLP